MPADDDARFLLRVKLQPLMFFSFEQSETTYEGVVRDLIDEGADSDTLEEMRQRYRALLNVGQLFAVPNEPRVVEKLLEPLRRAKAAFVFGDFLSTIALCGMVGEMIAIVHYDVAQFNIAGTVLNESQQGLLFGRSFEKLGQDRRLSVLRLLGRLTDEQAKEIDSIRSRRNKYLHLFSHSHAEIEADALQCFSLSVKAFVDLLGLQVDHGAMRLDDTFLSYLVRKGFLKQPPPETE